MCYPAYAGAQADPPSLKSYGETGEKAQSRQRRVEQYILKRFATQPARHREPLRRGGRAIGP
jgi:hypothetical protein